MPENCIDCDDLQNPDAVPIKGQSAQWVKLHPCDAELLNGGVTPGEGSPSPICCGECHTIDTNEASIDLHPDDEDVSKASEFNGPYDDTGDIQAGYSNSPVTGTGGDYFTANCTGGALFECDPINPRYFRYTFNIPEASSGYGLLEHAISHFNTVGRMWLNGHVIYDFTNEPLDVDAWTDVITQNVIMLSGENHMVWELFSDDPSTLQPLGENLFMSDARFTPISQVTVYKVVLSDGSIIWLDADENIIEAPANTTPCPEIISTITLCDNVTSFIAHTYKSGLIKYFSTNGITPYTPNGKVIECGAVIRSSVSVTGNTDRFDLSGLAFASRNITPEDEIRGITFWVISTDSSIGGEVEALIVLEDGSEIIHTLPFNGSHEISLKQGVNRYESPIVRIDFTELDNVDVKVRFNTISDRW